MNPRTATEQKCRDCGEWKPFDHFYLDAFILKVVA